MSQQVASEEDLAQLNCQESPSKEYETGISNRGSLSFKQRLLNKDRSRFNKYIQSTTTHGVVYIFIGKSKIRRLFWLVIVLTAGIGCLFNVSNRIIFLASGPTSTTVSFIETDSVDFPAVTLCNLNLIRKSYLESVSPGLAELIRNAFYAQGSYQLCKNAFEQLEPNSVFVNESFPDLLWKGRHTAEETISTCRFKGQECNWTDFMPVLTPSGVCYTFNSGKLAPIVKTNGTGIRFALSLIVNIQQHEYNAALNQDAGIKISVHPQNEPPQSDELGIAIPPGKNAFIGLKQRNIIHKDSKRKCRDASETATFNFLHGAFPYSVAACQSDCQRSNIAKKCQCLGSGTQVATSFITSKSQFHNLKNCTVEDLCCQAVEIYQHDVCDCPAACSKTQYTMAISYSAFPANYAATDLAESVNTQLNTPISTHIFQENFLGINIYFETLSLEEQITDNAYGIVALLSDIGGQLGLFLGASVISVFEFVTWLFDEIKDRCCGISERKIANKVKSSTAKCVHRCKWRKLKSRVADNGNEDQNRESDDYRNFVHIANL